jgi:hypothetical protein
MSGQYLSSARVMQSTSDVHALPSDLEQYPHGLVSLSSKTKMANITKRLGHVSIQEFKPSKFVKPQSVIYMLNGTSRRWCAPWHLTKQR